MIPSSAELTLLRTRPQATKLWLSVYKPPTVLACSVATSHGQGAYQIDYDTVTAGSYTSVESGMTMYVGSTPGASDIGKVRVRSIDANQITVAENYDINWTDGQYLTIIRFWEINTVYPRIIQNPADLTRTLWYKDYDIEYTWQNDVLGTFICMGSHYAGFIATGSCGVYYSASGTTNLIGQNLTYNWWFQGATVTGSSAHTPGFIQYNTPGHYTTRLQITTPSGTYDTSYRHISIYQKPELGTNNPILRWELKTLSGSRSGGGYTARISVYENFEDIVDGALVVIFAEDEYGDTKQSIGNGLNRGSIVFVGYILDGSVSIDYKTSSLEFSAGSPTEVMKQIEAFAVGVNSSADPKNEPTTNENIDSSWALVLNMDCRRAIYHYLRWHSTVLMTNDFEFSGTDQNIQYFDANRESLYSAISTLMNGTLLGEFVSSRSGKLWAEISSGATNNAGTAFPLNMSLENFDWLGTARIREEQVRRVSELELGGIYYPGPGNDSTPLLAKAPGASPSYRGTAEKLSGAALASQAQLNTLVGNLFAWKNARYPSVRLSLAGNYRNLDIAPIERVQMTLSSDDNIRGISWNRKNFTIQEMDFDYDPAREIFLPTVGLYEVTQGIDGTTISIPEVPPTTAPGGGGFIIPTLQIPSIPSSPISIVISGGGGGGNQIFVPVTGGYLVGAASDVVAKANSANIQRVACVAGDDTECGGILPIASDYSGTITVSLLMTRDTGVNANTIQVELYIEEWTPDNPSYWDDSGGNSDNTFVAALSVASFTSNRIVVAAQASISVSAGSQVILWGTRYGSSDSNTNTFGIVGWWIEYG